MTLRHLILPAATAVVLTVTSCSGDDLTEDAETAASNVDDAAEDLTDETLAVSERLDTVTEALDEGDFSTMLEALNLSSIADEIEGRAVTVLAPTDAAFAGLAADEIVNLLSNPTQVDDLLRHHVLDGAYPLSELAEMTSVTALDGNTLTVASDGGSVTVDGATITATSAESVDGADGEEVVVLSIDEVLTGRG